MINRKLLMATTITASLVIVACSDMTAPSDGTQAGTLSESSSAKGESSRRSGTFHVEKNCKDYHGLPGEICTITSSTLKEIKPGSRVIYATGAGATSLESDLVLDPPGRGKNMAVGHVVLDFATNSGVVTFSGGTGKFKKFHARVDVSYLGGYDWAWDGTYSFSTKGGHGKD